MDNISREIEKGLITHCSPTLASLKTASLFTLEFLDKRELSGILGQWNARLLKKGVVMVNLREKNGRALIYVFRVSRLASELSCPKISGFLRDSGYGGCDISTVISTLRTRLARLGEFPHEIGVFLGYPIGDVIGFIRNKGKNCRCSGCWKVYCDECSARKTFAGFKKCEEVYMRLWKQGKSALQLTVNS